MKKLQHAPGALEHVRAYVNTLDIEAGTEELGSPAALAAWLTDRDLAPAALRATRADLAHATELRESLRAILLTHNGEGPAPRTALDTLNEAARRARLALRFNHRGSVELEPEALGVDGALGRLLAIVHSSIAQGSWERLKSCRLHSCEWAFYDHTKNRSGAWCNMAVCGNRAKARVYRERRRSSDGHPAAER